jgi:Rrf2 family protein
LPAVLSQKTRYALKALLELAALPAGATLSSAAISVRRTIPVKFLEAILVELKRDGLVRGQRGRSGGYRLARSAKDISFGIVRLMEGRPAVLPCLSETLYRRCGDCADERACELKKLFRAVRDGTTAILDEWTLVDARGKAGPPEIHLSASTVKKSNRRSSVKRSLSGKGAAKDRP